jgi:hypothetical protein
MSTCSLDVDLNFSSKTFFIIKLYSNIHYSQKLTLHKEEIIFVTHMSKSKNKLIQMERPSKNKTLYI